MKADEVVERAGLVLLAQLHHRVGRRAAARILEADRLHWTERECPGAALRHPLDRQTALEVDRLLELVQRQLVGGDERGDERVVCVARERRVEIVTLALAGALPARGAK